MHLPHDDENRQDHADFRFLPDHADFLWDRSHYHADFQYSRLATPQPLKGFAMLLLLLRPWR